MITFISAIYFLYILIKVYVSVMEIGYVSKARLDDAVVLTPAAYVKAAEYKIASERFAILAALYDYALFLFWISFGLRWLDGAIQIDNQLIKSVLFVDAFIAISYVLTLPFDIYKDFVLDKKFGFSNIDAKLFISDLLKSAIIFFVAGSLIIWIVSFLIANFTYWWFFGFVFIFAIIILVNAIYPTLIAPMFNKFTVLEDKELKDSIEELMSKVSLKSSGIYVMDASKRDNRLNAYFGGLGKSKRVVLFDTLIKKLTKKELLAVLGHELGHFKHKDILKNIFMIAFVMFVLFAIFGNLPKELFFALGINDAPYAVISLFLLLSPVATFVFMPLIGIVSRKNEYKADEFGSECESPNDLANALIKLSEENKSFPKSHYLSIFFYHTHPPVVERLRKLGVRV